MKIAPIGGFLNESEVRMIHGAALRILDEVGVKVESEAMRKRLVSLGGQKGPEPDRVRFQPHVMERFIADSEPFDWNSIVPQVTANARIYGGHLLSPETGELRPWSEEEVALYFRLASELPEITGWGMLGCPCAEYNPCIAPLAERYLCWKYGGSIGGAIWDIRLAPYIVEMTHVMGEASGKGFGAHFAASVYLLSPLRFGRPEAEQMLWFADRNMRVNMGHMISQGGTGPATLAGCVALWVAEGLFINLVERALFGCRQLVLGASISPLDMRSACLRYGRPEKAIANLMMADMARFYRARATGQGGSTDAKIPGHEAGAQKALTAIPTLIAFGRANISAGVLSVDEIFSPIQMILDAELAAALRRFLATEEVTEETIAFDVIEAVGPGGFFTDTTHTQRNFRRVIWHPRIWSADMAAQWLAGGRKNDLDRAMEIYAAAHSRGPVEVQISSQTDRALKNIMRRAEREIS